MPGYVKHFLSCSMLLVIAGCSRDKPPVHADMKIFLKELNQKDIYPKDYTRNDLAVLYYKEQLAQNGDPGERVGIEFMLGFQELWAGENDSALAWFEKISTYPKVRASAENVSFLEELKGVAWQRKGEVSNCRLNHQANSCILPLAVNAIYKDTVAIERAIEHYTKSLEGNSKNYFSRWLINIAYCAIGKYPAGVPSKFLIILDKYASPDTIVKFKNVATEVLHEPMGHLGGNAIEDFDNDGYPDLFTTSFLLSDNVNLFFNNRDGTYKNYTSRAGLQGITGGANVITADYDNDGYTDIFVMRGGWLEKGGLQPNSLLKNNGNRTFTDVTSEAGLFSLHPTHSACWADVNKDGWLDLFVGHEKWDNHAGDQRSELFLNNHDGTFTECAIKCGINVNDYVKGVSFGDIDNDGFPDLFISTFGQGNLLFHNNGVNARGEVTFTEISEKAGVHEPMYSFPCMFFDFNNDGLEDIFVAGYYNHDVELASEYLGDSAAKHPPKLYLNNGNLTFSDITNQANLNRSIYAMGLNFADVDNDGFEDIYLGTGYGDFRAVWPNILLHNEGGKKFTDITATSGTGCLQKGHSVSFGDVNNDGYTDLLEDLGGFNTDDKYWNALFMNQGTANNWISLKLTGVSTNRSAIGARIKVTVEGSKGEQNIYKTVNTGASYGCNMLEQLIGIGNAPSVKQVDITWPVTSKHQIFKNIEVKKHYAITEGVDRIERVEKPKIIFKKQYDMQICR